VTRSPRPADEPPGLTARERAYWRRNLALTAVLLGVWFVATFVLAYFAGDLAFDYFGWPFAYWAAAQGAIVVYVAVIWVYARAMDRLDRAGGVAEPGGPDAR
jgi:putative solute:sodium symporter small subunit